MQPYPPLGTLYAAALLRQRGYLRGAVRQHACRPRRGNFSKTVAETRPRIVAIYEDNFNFLSKMCLSRMRQIAFGMIDTAEHEWCKGCRERIRRVGPLRRLPGQRRRLRSAGRSRMDSAGTCRCAHGPVAR